MLYECHAHLMMDGKNYKDAVLRHKDGVCFDALKANLNEYKKLDIGFIRDGGDKYHVSENAKALAADMGIDYRTPMFAIHKKGYYGSIVGRSFENEKEYIELVKEADKLGCDFIKIMVSGIMDFDEAGKLSCDGLPEEDIKMMISIAKAEGFAVMVHGNGKNTVETAVSAGADSIEHGNFIDEETLRAMKEMDCIYVPTFSPIGNLLNCGRFYDAEVMKILEWAKINVKRAFELDVNVASGSDAGAYLVDHGQGIMDELGYFKEVIPDENALDKWLTRGNEMIRSRFKRN